MEKEVNQQTKQGGKYFREKSMAMAVAVGWKNLIFGQGRGVCAEKKDEDGGLGLDLPPEEKPVAKESAKSPSETNQFVKQKLETYGANCSDWCK